MILHTVKNRVVVRGAGEMASGVIKHLALAGYEVIALERPAPSCVRRYVCYAEAFFKERVTIESVTAILVNTVEEAVAVTGNLIVPLLIDPAAAQLFRLAPWAVVDGRMLKQRSDASLEMAPAVIGLGPGFTVSDNCHAAVETSRGANLGRVLYAGSPQPYTGVPASVEGYDRERVLRSPAEGIFEARCRITDAVQKGQVLGQVASVQVVGAIDGVVRGLIHNGSQVVSGQKIGDIDPRGVREYCYRMSDKANAIGQGVLQALRTLNRR
jgi:xanthine dehydrogenase accessory factor